MDHSHPRADGLRFASDLTDAEWRIVAPLLPAGSPVGRRPSWPLREIVNAIFYVPRGGVSWRMLPPCFPPSQTVYDWFAAWRDAGVWQTINHHLVMMDRQGRRPRGESERRGDRQPEREDDRGRWPTRLRRRLEDQGPQAARAG